MLISRVDANDDATQFDSKFNNHFASDKSIKSNEGFELSFEENTRSSTNESIRLKHSIVERLECVIEAKIFALASNLVLEALDSEFVTLGLGSSKKLKKKLKIFARQAIFEEN